MLRKSEVDMLLDRLHGSLGRGALIIVAIMTILALIRTTDSLAQESERTVAAVIVRINGGIDYRPGNDGDWKPGRIKQPLYDGDQLRTSTGQKAVILYNSSTRVLVNENTIIEISVQRSSPGAKPTGERTRLIMGDVFSKVRKGTNYDVETPTSVASVRGTQFNASYRDGMAQYLVLESVVEVMNQLGSVLLRQLQAIDVGEGDTPDESDVRTLSRNQAEGIVDWTGDVEPSWRLNMVPEGGNGRTPGKEFGITVWAEAFDTGTVDGSATFALSSLAAVPQIIEFSTDNGATWSLAPAVTIVNGQAALLARFTGTGDAQITAQAEDAEPATLSLSAGTEKDRIKIELMYTDPEGTGDTSLIIDLEEK